MIEEIIARSGIGREPIYKNWLFRGTIRIYIIIPINSQKFSIGFYSIKKLSV